MFAELISRKDEDNNSGTMLIADLKEQLMNFQYI